ncbi:SPFH domain-containing protein, partial [Streptomyces sp. NPDC005899]|uniref:SPFH domain-containing protein n=1 Tax=Streptomyces sp. NPDC005899 TaxID=3155716 RepID=UPI0033F15DD6
PAAAPGPGHATADTPARARDAVPAQGGHGAGSEAVARGEEAEVPDAARDTAPPGQADGAERTRGAAAVRPGDGLPWSGPGVRRPRSAGAGLAPTPVRLLHRDDPAPGDGTAPRPVGVAGPPPPTGGAPGPGVRRPPMPRSPLVRQAHRPAPLPDPRLNERPGPVLPGWAALLAGTVGVAAQIGVLAWHGVLPDAVTDRLGMGVRPYGGIGFGAWGLLALLMTVVVLALGGLGRGRAGYASVLTLFGDYRGSVRRTGLIWASPLLLRRRVDVRLRHWRSEPLPVVDAGGTALRAVVLVVWRVKDTARATLGVADHEQYLRDQVEAAVARVLSQLPVDAFDEDVRTLRDAEAVGDALTRTLQAECSPVGVEVYSAQPTGIEYAPEVAAAMRRRRVAALDARHRDGVLTSVVDAVEDTVGRLTSRGIVELDDYEHKALVRDLTVAFYTGRAGGDGA